MQPFHRLDNPVLDYAWGSSTAIPELLGRPNPDGGPQAELWIGAHPKAPSRIVDAPAATTLDALIRADPLATLGRRVAERFGELPFLLKVLAAAKPLSVQCHPNRDQAQRGFARENAKGIPLSASHRNYRDPNHKPELLAALGPFSALKGFRPAAEVVALLRAANVRSLAVELAALQAGGDAASLRQLFAHLLSLPPPRRRRVLSEAVIGAAQQAGEPAFDWVGRLAESYPDDVGALMPLMLNLVRLDRGDALFLEAGELHAYLEGVALELMANSDNVLRGGLTPKHIDLNELLEIGRFDPHRPLVLRPHATAAGVSTYETPAEEFEMSLIEVASSTPVESDAAGGPQILIVLDGEVTIREERESLGLSKGQSVFVPASVGRIRLQGEARLCRARVAPAVTG